jgi:hypothetical protein
MGKGIVAVAAAVALTAGAAAKPAMAAERSCASVGRTVAANEQARVFRVVQLGEPVFFACRYGDPRGRMLLTRRSMDFVWPKIVLAGERVLVAEGLIDRHHGDQEAKVQVLSLRRRRSERRWFFNHRFEAGGPRLAVHAPVLRPDGSAAFLAGPITPSSSSVASTYQVHRADASGKSIVAAGPDLDARSLAVGEGRLYWTRAGVPASAPFRPRKVRPVRDRSPRSRCSRPRSRTLALNARIRVFAVPQREDPDLETVSACRLRTGRILKLGAAGFRNNIPAPVAVAGERVLTATRDEDYTAGDRTLTVSVDSVPGGEGAGWRFWEQRRAVEASLELRGSALKPSGAAAFLAGPITDTTTPDYASRFEVHASTPAGKQRLLDAGADIAPGSFAAGERRIYWVRAGTIRSAGWP